MVMTVDEYECFGNFEMTVRARTKASLQHALALAMAHHGGRVYAWAVDLALGLVLYWGKPNGAAPLPTPLDVEGATDLAWRWLSEMGADDRSGFKLKGDDVRVDHGGDTYSLPAFRVHVGKWGKFDGHDYAVCAVLPCWAWIGK